jgi:hypothetical protein
VNIEQAIEILLDKYGKADEEQEQAIATAIKALEKQIPYKPTERKGFEGKCKCGVVFLDRLTNYCGNCGQKLDWEVLE